MVVNLEKLKDAITISDGQVEESKGSGGPAQSVAYEPIDTTGLSDEDFLNKARDKILPIKKNGKNLHKETFVKIFHYTADFAKFQTAELKKKS